MTCSVTECGGVVHRHDLCGKHYRIHLTEVAPPCIQPECEKPARCRGLCNTHYHRLLRHGDPSLTKYGVGGVGRRGVVEERCGVFGCPNRGAGHGIAGPHGGRGWCHSHYQTWKRHGHPLGVGRGVKRPEVREARMKVNRLLDDAVSLAELNRRHDVQLVIAKAREIAQFTPAQEGVAKALVAATDFKADQEARVAEVMELTRKGHSAAVIGQRLGISARTVVRFRRQGSTQ